MLRALRMIRFRVLLVFFLLCLAGSSAQALEILEKRWGFDGKVYPGYFNLLSVRVGNGQPRPFDGALILEERRGLENRVGAPYAQPLYLAPNQRRWVQFYVYIGSAGGDWRLQWGRGNGETDALEGAAAGPPGRVLLIDPESPFASAGALKAFPDDLFPPTVAATDGLDAVVLDHVPRWEPARREAFLDWLHRGGTVHVLRGVDGEFPQFRETLAALNGATDRTRVGAGWVVRHARPRSQVDDRFLAAAGFPPLEFHSDKKEVVYNFDDGVLQSLAALTKPQIVWSIIYLLTCGYVLVVGPLHYRWSKRIHYLRSIGLLLVLVGGFAAAFAYAGRRGSSERAQISALAIAHSLGDGRHDVTQWISAFATEGDLYRFSHRGASNLYAPATSFDSVKGTIINGREGRFEADVPLYSSRPFVHRGVLQGDHTEVKVARWETDAAGALTRLELLPGPGFPGSVEHAWVRYRGAFRTLELVGGQWQLKAGDAQSESEFFSASVLARLNKDVSYVMTSYGASSDPAAKEHWIESLGQPLIARALGSVEGLPSSVQRPTRPEGHLELFVYAPLPDGFHVQDARFSAYSGRVLYVQDVFQP